MKSFKVLKLGLLEEGELLKAVDAEFARVAKAMCKYTKDHGELAKGAKAEVTLKLSVRCDSPDDETYIVAGALSSKVPARPARATMAIADIDDDGNMALFSRASGTTADDPRQERMFTNEGETIDPDTGEVEVSGVDDSTEYDPENDLENTTD